ncbi:hypothetical protein GP486_004783 [Trichoglossum hirsutum]|uniref:Dihydroorotase n=1 Tax=Trichoglossum hirsutum TaxID=265104 RepID=A0A9P8LAP6_9PEZI|nr:hypothetical protein GP486_004783 [Trichoglossum hirsutum]
MKLKSLSYLELPPTADFHCHLRQEAMMELCAPLVKNGGCDTVYVMPNLQPPITQVSEAISYHERLSRLAPDVTFLMSLFLHPGLNAAIIAEAARTGIIYGVKLYPAGVTTNSQGGVIDIEKYYPVFKAMEANGLVLNLHGEAVSSPPAAFAEADGAKAVTVLNAETTFLPQLYNLHAAFPKLSIVLEHVSTREGLEAVRRCGPTVAGSITAHHLWMTVDDWCADVFSFCKPVAKKGAGATAAGCFTQPWCSALVIGALEEAIDQGWVREEEVTREYIEGFLSGYGREFYKIPRTAEGPRIRLERRGEIIPEAVSSQDGSITVVPFGRGKEVLSLSWTRS